MSMGHIIAAKYRAQDLAENWPTPEGRKAFGEIAEILQRHIEEEMPTGPHERPWGKGPGAVDRWLETQK